MTSDLVRQRRDVDFDGSLDLLWGVDAIAKEINRTHRQTYHQLETGQLPARKQAGRWCASRVGLRTFFADILAGDVEGKSADSSRRD